jgi:glutathione S-transferase
MLTFFMTPGSCSTGIHILLEALELPFQVTVLNLPAGDHRQPAYLALNPKGSIPALQLDDGRVLTEFGAIAHWLARRVPRAQLLPDDGGRGRADRPAGLRGGHRARPGLDPCLHAGGYLPPGLEEAEPRRWTEAIQARGREIVQAGFAVLEQALAAESLDRRLNLADAALFYVFFWAEHTGLPLPPHCAAHLAWMRRMPVVQQVLAEEGYRR